MSGVCVTGRPRARFTAERAGPGRVLVFGLVALLALLGACQQPARAGRARTTAGGGPAGGRSRHQPARADRRHLPL